MRDTPQAGALPAQADFPADLPAGHSFLSDLAWFQGASARAHQRTTDRFHAGGAKAYAHAAKLYGEFLQGKRGRALGHLDANVEAAALGEVVDGLAAEAVEFPLHKVADRGHVAASHGQDAVVTALNLNGEPAALRVDADDGAGAHARTVAATEALIAFAPAVYYGITRANVNQRACGLTFQLAGSGQLVRLKLPIDALAAMRHSFVKAMDDFAHRAQSAAPDSATTPACDHTPGDQA